MDDGYDLKIFKVINTHKKHPHVIYPWFNKHNNQVSKQKNINYKSSIKEKINYKFTR